MITWPIPPFMRGSTKAVALTLQAQADRLCGLVTEPQVLPALTHGASTDGLGLIKWEERCEQIFQRHRPPLFPIDPQYTEEHQDARRQYDERVLYDQTNRIMLMINGHLINGHLEGLHDGAPPGKIRHRYMLHEGLSALGHSLGLCGREGASRAAHQDCRRGIAHSNYTEGGPMGMIYKRGEVF